MAENEPLVLIVGNETGIGLIEHHFTDGFTVEHLEATDDLRSIVETKRPDFLILLGSAAWDVALDDLQGIRMRSCGHFLPVILVTGIVNRNTVNQAVYFRGINVHECQPASYTELPDYCRQLIEQYASEGRKVKCLN